MTGEESTWFHNAPESRQLLEIERAKVEALEAAAEITAYLDNVERQFAAMDLKPSDVIAFASTLERGTAWLKMSDLRAVLGENREMREAFDRLGEETRTTEWVTQTPDGTLSRADSEDWARERVARAQGNHGVQLAVMRREVRRFIGGWQPADATTGAAADDAH